MVGEIGTQRPQVVLTATAMAIGFVVTLGLLAAAVWAASVDLASEYERNAVPLDVLSTLYKLLSVAGLVILAGRLGSRSLRLIALLLALMTVGSLLVDTTWFNEVLNRVSDPLAEILPMSSGSIKLAGLFLALAFVAGGLVFGAWRSAAPEERSVVLTLIALLFVVGIFVGPVNAIASAGINREWLFAEDFGQVVSMSFLAGYLSALLVATAADPG